MHTGWCELKGMQSLLDDSLASSKTMHGTVKKCCMKFLRGALSQLLRVLDMRDLNRRMLLFNCCAQ